MFDTEVGSVPGFSGDNILQSNLFVYLPHGGNLGRLACLETIQRNFSVNDSCHCNVLSVHYRAQCRGGFGSVLHPGSSRKQPLKLSLQDPGKGGAACWAETLCSAQSCI